MRAELQGHGFKLIEFLDARIAEDEAVVPKLHDWAHGNTTHGWYGEREPVSRREIAYGQTATRVLAECEAKRQILDRWQDLEVQQLEAFDQTRNTLSYEYAAIGRAMATVYADHPDYLKDWRP